MTDAQTILNQKYPNKSQVEEIDLECLKKFNQPSEIVIADYPHLKEIIKYTSRSIPNLTKLTIQNCPHLETINISDLKNNQQLILNNLPNLKRLDCLSNNLTTLEINNCDNLEKIHCISNKLLIPIKLPLGEKLEVLFLSNSNFPKQDLSFCKDLVNLKELWLSSSPFYGSLEYLKNMSKLEILDISYTDIDSGLEYLPDSLKDFACLILVNGENDKYRCKAIYNLFANDQGKVEIEALGYIINFRQKLQEIKQKLQGQSQQQAQIIQKEPYRLPSSSKN